MEQCNVAIVPASSLLFEIVAIKMPVISGYFVENQKDVYKGFLDAGLIIGIWRIRGKWVALNLYFRRIEALGPEHIIEKQEQADMGNAPENIQRIFKTLSRGAIIHS